MAREKADVIVSTKNDSYAILEVERRGSRG